jgi:hypothetical protein
MYILPYFGRKEFDAIWRLIPVPARIFIKKLQQGYSKHLQELL